MKNLKNKTEIEIEMMIENGEFFKILSKSFLKIEEESFDFFNKLNNEFTEDENIEFFLEKKIRNKEYLITEEGLESFFIKNMKRKPFEIEKQELITCDNNLRKIFYK